MITQYNLLFRGNESRSRYHEDAVTRLALFLADCNLMEWLVIKSTGHYDRCVDFPISVMNNYDRILKCLKDA